MEQMSIPNEALKYILFQRTAYLWFHRTWAYRVLKKIIPFSFYNWEVAIEAKLSPARVKALYENDMRQEYASIKDFLPETCSSIMDIGCGVAGIDVFLNKHYQGLAPKFNLLDKTQTEPAVFYKFKTRAAFYNSLAVAKTMLMSNNIPENRVNLIEATDNNDININSSVDLIISLISWGFHYPVETYLDRAYEVLNEGGTLIIDVRKGTNGLDLIKNKFGKVDIIGSGEKYQRILARK